MARWWGQTRNIRARLAAHTRPGSTHHSASFAFLLAKAQAARKGIRTKGVKREALENSRRFRPLFTSAKARVAAMEVQFVKEKDPNLRTVFEVYAMMRLGTEKYNSFETH